MALASTATFNSYDSRSFPEAFRSFNEGRQAHLTKAFDYRRTRTYLTEEWERSKWARIADYVGAIPIFWVSCGVVRIIAGLASAVFYTLRSSENEVQKREYSIRAKLALNEIKRGFWELIPAMSIHYLINAEVHKEGILKDTCEHPKFIKGLISETVQGCYAYFNANDGKLYYSDVSFKNKPIFWVKEKHWFLKYADDNDPYLVYVPYNWESHGLIIKEAHVISLESPV